MKFSFLFSLPIYLLIEHPFDLSKKIAYQLNLRKQGYSRRKRIGSKRSLRVMSLVSEGEFSKALKIVNADWKVQLRYPFLRPYLKNQLAELNMYPPAHWRPKTKKVVDNGNLNVLYLLTNSFPYTNSGYSVRSHELLKVLNLTNLSVIGVTRLGYPITIGKLLDKDEQIVEGVKYNRMIPDWMPLSFEKRMQKSVALVVELARKKDISLLHTTTNFSNAIVASRAARELGIPWIYEVRGELENTWLSRLTKSSQRDAKNSEFYQKVRDLETRYAKDADAVVALSAISKRQLISRGVDESKIFLAPNGIDGEILEKEFDKHLLREKFGLPTDKKIVGTVSSLVNYEGIQILVQALVYLPNSYVILIVGDGLERRPLQDLVCELELEDRVIFVGKKNQSGIDEWYAVLDIFVLPRLNTPVCRTVTPLKALAAQAMGLPVVASDLPAIREVTGNVEAYVRAESPEYLARKILEVKSHTKGKEWASTRTWKSSASNLEAVYKKVFDSNFEF